MQQFDFSGVEAWQSAWYFAAEVHAGQTVPGSEIGYVRHLGSVMMEVLAAHAALAIPDLDLAVQCAILHDCIEDQGVAHCELVARFGQAVADGVLALSKRADLPKAEAMVDSLQRIQQQPTAVWCVKLADRICNLNGMPAGWSLEKAAKYQREAERILAALAPAHPWLAERLAARISGYLPASPDCPAPAVSS